MPKSLIFENIKDFDPVAIFECGQCFRWNPKEKSSSYIGVAGGRAVEVELVGNNLIIHDAPEKDRAFWSNYFDLQTDYGKIKKLLSKDPVMKKAVNFGRGIRLLRQDLHETLISFIISSNNHIPRIKKIIETLSVSGGEPIETPNGTFYSFPKLETLANYSCEQIAVTRAGYRCNYILESANRAVLTGLDPSHLATLSYEDARKKLEKFTGVGEKVADCTLLFTGIKREAFPVDVWIKRIMEELFIGKTVSKQYLREYANEKFGEHAGIAQQYLFYYARENKIGK
jgi:N-glycosylase/DNA lyase